MLCDVVYSAFNQGFKTIVSVAVCPNYNPIANPRHPAIDFAVSPHIPITLHIQTAGWKIP
jgi:hypothetical protein